MVALPDPTAPASSPALIQVGGLIHGGARARLAPAHAQRIIAITDAGDQGLIALRACQAYVREVNWSLALSPLDH